MKQLVVGIATPEEYQQYIEDVAAGKVKALPIKRWFNSFDLFTMWANSETTKTLYDQLQDIELEYITDAPQEPDLSIWKEGLRVRSKGCEWSKGGDEGVVQSEQHSAWDEHLLEDGAVLVKLDGYSCGMYLLIDSLEIIGECK